MIHHTGRTRTAVSILSFLTGALAAHAGELLRADGPGNTYELVRSKGLKLEVPDCIHPQRHVSEVWDDALRKHVFAFDGHVEVDNDRCKNLDRARTELTVADGRPPRSLAASDGRTFSYAWKFRLDPGFRANPSFSHIHQIKAVGGEDPGAPMITLTTRAGNPETLQLLFTRPFGDTDARVLDETPLAPFKGAWIEARELVTFGDHGRYEIALSRASDGQPLFRYRSDDIAMSRAGAEYYRPKVGLYRSLRDRAEIRDESVRVADYCIAEGEVCSGDGSHEAAPAAPAELEAKAVSESEIDLAWREGAFAVNDFRIESSSDGGRTWSWTTNVFPDWETPTRSYRVTRLAPGTEYRYRMRAENLFGASSYSNVAFARTRDVRESSLGAARRGARRVVAGQTPRHWSLAIADTIMERYPDLRKAYWRPWTYVNGYLLDGFDKLYRASGDRRYFEYLKRYADSFVDGEGRIGLRDAKGVFQELRFEAVDDILTGTILVDLYEHTKDERYRTAAGRIRKAFDDYPRNSDGGFWHGRSLPGEMWIDGVFMGQLFLARYGQASGDGPYCFDEVVRQITVFAGHCRKGDSGLYYHAWAARPELATVVGDHRPARETLWADPKTGLSSEVWSEGLGWYALLLADTLAALPPEHPRRAEVVDIFTRLAEGLRRTQDPESGRWFQVVDKGNRGDNWTDTSGSAMFTYAIRKGIDLGLLDRKVYGPVADKGYRGIVAKAKVNREGLVDVYDACQGLCVQASYADYIHYPRAVNGNEAVTGFLWATAAVEAPALARNRRR